MNALGIATLSVSVVVGSSGLAINLKLREKRIAKSQDAWTEVRRGLADHPIDARRVAECYQASASFPLTEHGVIVVDEIERIGGRMLRKPSWRLERPIPLADVRIQLNPNLSYDSNLVDQTPATIVPRRSWFKRFRSYSEALNSIKAARPALLNNDPCYRLDSVDLESGSLTLHVSMMEYFDFVNEGEAMRHEWAVAKGDLSRCPLRTATGDLTNFHQRGCLIGVNVMTTSSDNARTSSGFGTPYGIT